LITFPDFEKVDMRVGVVVDTTRRISRSETPRQRQTITA